MMSEHENPAHAGRIALVIAFICLWCFLILGRLCQLQIVRHDELLQQAQERQQVVRLVRAPRGVIYDSRMDELATSMSVNTVIVVPRRIKDIPAAAASLAAILDLDAGKLRERMMDPKRRGYLVVKRRIDPQDEARIAALGTEGIELEEESLRVYPNRDLACHVLGFVNMEGAGGGGIEMQYDRELRGEDGRFASDVDARRRSFRATVLKPPVQGRSLILSLDKTLQYIAERELALGVQDARAASGNVIIMEPDTGRILALANYPSFNSNRYNDAEPDLWRNRAVTDLFEPGSTFKVVVAAAALDRGLTRPGEVIDCQMGSIIIGRHVFHDHKPYGLLTFSQVLEYSSNIGAAKLGLRLGQELLHRALLDFGFGARTGIDLPGEIIGLVRSWQNWSALSIGAISFGQEVGVTSLQILRAINAIANGGYLVRPTVVDRVIDEQGDLVHVTAPGKNRIMSPATAQVVRDAFAGVVLRGTGRRAAVEGYRCAGKTGTAQKIVDGHYSDSKYLASFVGFAPLPAPRLSILVQIDEPKGKIYGGDVAAPIFAKIAQEALLHLRVPPDSSLPLPALKPTLASAAVDYAPNATPAAPITAAQDVRTQAGVAPEIIVAAGPDSAALPDFNGMDKRRVIERCLDLGLKLQIRGSGTAVHQEPPPGTLMASGDTCSVTFARAPQGPRSRAGDPAGAGATAAPNQTAGGPPRFR